MNKIFSSPIIGKLRSRARGEVRSILHGLVSGSGLQSRLDRVAWSGNASQGTQILLAMLYKERAERRGHLPTLDEVEFRVHSQNGEDGILLYLFSLLGAPTKKCIEICAGDGIVCNTANLIVNHGWRGLLFDGNELNIRRGKQFYRTCRDTRWYPPRIVQSWITMENVDALVEEHGFSGEVDLLSLDLDGVDYWIWKGLTNVAPRVVVAEFNWGWGSDESMTVPYDPGFVRNKRYYGASLQAFTKLAREKGYRLVGTQQWGFNAFFVRDGVGEEWFPEVTPEQCFDTPVMRQRWTPESRDDLLWRGEWVPV